MFVLITLFVGIFGLLSNGIPLESPTADFKQFFDSRIVGGQDAIAGSAPHMVGLLTGNNLFRYFMCGGSIVGENHVLTAAHCIAGVVNWDGTLLDMFFAVVGSNSWQTGLEIQFKEYKIHPDYNALTIKYDVGVLVTKEKIKLSETVAVIGLNFNWVDGGEDSFVTGWGTQELGGLTPSILQHLYVKTITPQQCQDSMLDVDAWIPPIDSAIEICTFHSPGHGMCHGDSGSALVSTSNGLQIGIVSWGFPCAAGRPDMFARVSGMADFIKSSIS